MEQSLQKLTHINYPDDANRIYCRKLNKVITLDGEGKFWETCTACPLFAGDYQGNGVECSWEDVENSNIYCENPVKEQLRVSQLVDDGVLTLKKDG